MSLSEIIKKHVERIYRKNVKPTVFCLVGESGSGKTWVATELSRTGVCPSVVSYTTREMRPGETDGQEHWFVTHQDYEELYRSNPDDIAAYTLFGMNHYWTTHSQMKSLGQFFTYVVDEAGVDYFRKFSDQYNIVTIKINRPVKDGIDKDRQDRDCGMFTKNDSEYDHVVLNDGSKEKFYFLVKYLIESHKAHYVTQEELEGKLREKVQGFLLDAVKSST